MISIVTYHSDEGIHGFHVSGHAGDAAYGHDIVCAAVSVLAQATVLGVDSVLSYPMELEVETGLLDVKVQPSTNDDACEWEKVQVLLETAVLAFHEIYEQYPKRIQITESWR